MANGYKAPSGLSSAVRGRSMVQRDYTSGVKFKATEREANRAALQSTLGIVQGIAGGAAELSKAVETNILSHERAEEGARRIFESSPEFESGRTFEQSGFKGANLWDRWTKSAGEFSDTQSLGGKEFSTANLINLGGLDSVAATRTGTAIKDESGNITGRKSLWESYGTEKNQSLDITSPTMSPPSKSEKKDASQIIKNNNQQQQKQNATGGQPPEQDDGIIGGAENLPPKLKEQYDASVKGTKPMEGEKFRAYKDRLRTMGLDPSARDEEGNLLYPHTRYEDL